MKAKRAKKGRKILQPNLVKSVKHDVTEKPLPGENVERIVE